MLICLSDFHKSAPYVVTGSVDQTVKVWECRWDCLHLLTWPALPTHQPLSPIPNPPSCTSVFFFPSWQPEPHPPTCRTPNHSWPWRFTFSPSPSLLPYIGPALLRWQLSFYVNYSGCRVRLINVTQSLTHKHTQKMSIPLHGESSKTCILLNLLGLHTVVMTSCRVTQWYSCWCRWILVNSVTAASIVVTCHCLDGWQRGKRA